MIRLIDGIVTYRIRAHLPAPSKIAASVSSFGTDCSPAHKKHKISGNGFPQGSESHRIQCCRTVCQPPCSIFSKPDQLHQLVQKTILGIVHPFPQKDCNDHRQNGWKICNCSPKRLSSQKSFDNVCKKNEITGTNARRITPYTRLFFIVIHKIESENRLP